MVIVDQDRGTKFRTGKVYFKEHYAMGCFMGWNIYGKKFLKQPILLGTYDTEEDATQIVSEIYTLKKHGRKKYSMPEASLQLDELEDVYYGS